MGFCLVDFDLAAGDRALVISNPASGPEISALRVEFLLQRGDIDLPDDNILSVCRHCSRGAGRLAHCENKRRSHELPIALHASSTRSDQRQADW